MAQKKPTTCTRSHAYGLQIQHCPSCGVHIASQCPECGYTSRYDDEHRPHCEAFLLPEIVESPADIARAGQKQV